MSKLLTYFPDKFSASMMGELTTCETSFFRHYIQHLNNNVRNPDLIAGGHIAKACEIVRTEFFNNGLDAASAIELGQDYILSSEDTGDSVKSNENVAFALGKYFMKFPLATSLPPCKLVDGTHAIEYKFDFDLGIPHPDRPDRNITFTGKLDYLCEKVELTKTTRYALDEKTCKNIFRLSGSKTIDYKKEADQYRTEGQLLAYCLTGEHEVLTKEGWLRLDSLQKDIDILCWDDGNLFFDTPTEYIKTTTDVLVTYSGQSSLKGTPDHRQVVLNRKTKKYHTFTLDTIPEYKDQFQFITAGLYSETSDIHTPKEYIQLLVAAQADGCWTSDGNIPKLQFSFAKQRKVLRLENILKSLDILYTKNVVENANYSTGTVTYFRLLDNQLNIELFSMLGRRKDFSSWLLTYSGELLDTFIAELEYWDGHREGGRVVYSSTNLNNIDWVQTICALRNRSCNIQENSNNKRNKKHSVCYKAHIGHSIYKAVTTHQKTIEKVDNIPVYCVSVPSSYFMVKHKDKIMITGNCWAAKQLGVPINSFLIRRIPIMSSFESSFELEIPITDFAIDLWFKSMYNTILALVEKYKIYKEFIEKDSSRTVHEVFLPAFSKTSCLSYSRTCRYIEGCISKEGEQMLGELFQQRLYDRDNRVEVDLETYLKGVKL